MTLVEVFLACITIELLGVLLIVFFNSVSIGTIAHALRDEMPPGEDLPKPGRHAATARPAEAD